MHLCVPVRDSSKRSFIQKPLERRAQLGGAPTEKEKTMAKAPTEKRPRKPRATVATTKKQIQEQHQKQIQKPQPRVAAPR
jgi:hypothetical protein